MVRLNGKDMREKLDETLKRFSQEDSENQQTLKDTSYYEPRKDS